MLQPARYYGLWGGRGAGKSHAVAEMLIEKHVSGKFDTVCVRETQCSLRESVKKLLELKIQALGVGPLFDVQEAVIKVKNGGQIIFIGMQTHTAESIKSLEGFDLCWVEESQSLSQRSLDLLRPTIRKPGSELWFTWNPNKITDPIDSFLRGDNPPPNAVVVEVNYYDNPWFPEVLKNEMLYDRSRDIDKYNHTWLGQYNINSEARVFKNWKVADFTRPEGTIYRFGADWGYSNDPTVLIRISTQGNKLYFDYEAHMVGCEIVNLPDLFDRVPESRNWFITADSARPETISYMRQHGFPKINPAKKGPDSVKEGIEFLKSFDIVIHPRCVETIKEFTNYSYKIDSLTGFVTPILEDKDNHFIDSARMALEAVRAMKEKKAIPFIPPYRASTPGFGY